MKPNFAAWELDPNAFDALPNDQKLAFLVKFAVLAPSSHNSQPWKFLVGENEVTVTADMTRSLPASDPKHRQLYESIGCALENLLIAADYYGYQTSVERHDADGVAGWRVRFGGEPLAASDRTPEHRALSIARRVTNREKFEDRMPAQDFVTWMRGMANEDLGVVVVEQGPKKTEVVKAVSDALIEAMDNTGFRKELSGYIRPNITSAMTGMPMYGFGMPTPPSFLAPFIVRFVNVNKASRKADEAVLLTHTPMLVVLTTCHDKPEDWVAAARTFQRIAVEAVRRGMCASPLAAAIEWGNDAADLQKTIGSAQRPQLFFRLGYPTKPAIHSPRIPAEQVTVHLTAKA